MGYQVGVIDALKDWGLTVVEVPGWQTRGSSSFSPRGHVCHHDVIPPYTSTPAIIIDGRSDLAGPLANFWMERNGRVHLVAAGRANHAGQGGWQGLYGNSSVWGTEANNLGTPTDPWPEAQVEAWVTLCAATADFSGFAPSMICGHKEWTTRKVDPHSIDMGAFRVRVTEALRRGPKIPDDQHQENDMVIYTLKGQHAVAAGSGSPGLVVGTVDAHREAGIPIVELPNNRAGRAVYDRARRENVPFVQRIFRTRAA